MAASTNAVENLFAANAQWAADVAKAEPNFFKHSATGQTPHTLWIGCSDSRVPESVVTGSKPGDLFVHRNVANQFHPDDASIAAVVTYAVENVGVQHISIVGHTECGGAAACLGAASAASSFTHEPIATVGAHAADHPLNRWLEPLTRLTHRLGLSSADKNALAIVVEENVKVQVEHLAKFDTIVQAWTKGTPMGQDVWIHGWVYDLSTGKLRDLNISQGPRHAKGY